MKKLHSTSIGTIKVLAILAFAFGLTNVKAHAQTISRGSLGDTVTYVIYNSDLNFDAKRTLVLLIKKVWTRWPGCWLRVTISKAALFTARKDSRQR